MKIIHKSIFTTDKIEEHYTKKDGVPVKYVLTSTIPETDVLADIFYRDTPHPEFGNRYFALIPKADNMVAITNADAFEGHYIGMVMNDEGDLEYSSYRHDYKSFDNGSVIDGGRDYVRGNKILPYRIINGNLVEDV